MNKILRYLKYTTSKWLQSLIISMQGDMLLSKTDNQHSAFDNERLRKVKFGEGENMSLWGVATTSSKILCEMS